MLHAFMKPQAVQALADMMDKLDKQHLRGMQKEMFTCSARCCDDTSTQEELQRWCAALRIVPPQPHAHACNTELAARMHAEHLLLLLACMHCQHI